MTSFETIQKAQAGDIDARNQVILENLGLIKKIANMSQRDRFEDAVQDGIFGVIRALKTYDVMKGGFNTYMGLWVRRTMQERTGYREDTILNSGEARFDVENGEVVEIPIKEIAVETPDMTWLHEAIATLDSRERVIVDLIYFHDATLTQCCELMGLCRATVNKIHQGALKKLREVLK